MPNQDEYIVYQVRQDQLPRLVELEERWGRIPGAPLLTLEDLTKWYTSGTPYFFVAEHQDSREIRAYYYALRIEFDGSPAAIRHIADHPTMTKLGAAEIPHTQSGEAFYGINITSEVTAAADALHQYVTELVIRERITYFIGVSRLGLFHRYLRSHRAFNNDSRPTNMREIATWYAQESIRLTNRADQHPATPPHPELTRVRRPDTVIKHHVKGMGFSLLEIIPYLQADVESCGLGALLLSRYPHKL